MPQYSRDLREPYCQYNPIHNIQHIEIRAQHTALQSANIIESKKIKKKI